MDKSQFDVGLLMGARVIFGKGKKIGTVYQIQLADIDIGSGKIETIPIVSVRLKVKRFTDMFEIMTLTFPDLKTLTDSNPGDQIELSSSQYSKIVVEVPQKTDNSFAFSE